MIRRLVAVIVAAAALRAQTPDLIGKTDELQRAIATEDWNKAATLSRSLKQDVTDARNRSLAGEESALANTTLNWMPADTETFLVAQQPFAIPTAKDAGDASGLEMAQGFLLMAMEAAENGKLLTDFAGKTVKFAASGARNFHNQKEMANGGLPLGMIAYEGCSLYAFTEALPDSLIARPGDDLVSGNRVWISKGSMNDTPNTDTYFVTLLQPDQMLVCNDRTFLNDVISRRKMARGPRALPASLPEWKYVDRTAPLWAISHYAKGFLPPFTFRPEQFDAAHPPSGISVAFTPGKSVARILSAKNPFDAPNAADPDIPMSSRKIADGVWELTISDSGQGAPTAAMLFMGMLGFVVLM